MNKKLPFEEIFKRKMNELSLPGENESWQKMMLLLDEKEKRKPFIFFRNNSIKSSVLLLLLLCLWLVISPEQIRKQAVGNDAKYTAASKQHAPQPTKDATTNSQPADIEIFKQPDDSLSLNQTEIDKGITLLGNTTLLSKSKQANALNKQFIVRKNHPLIVKSNKVQAVKKSNSKSAMPVLNSDNINSILTGAAIHRQNVNNAPDSSERFTDIFKKDIASLLVNRSAENIKTYIANDSLQHAINKTATTPKTPVTIKKHNTYFIDAGIGLKQQIPISGQKLIAYNYTGTKSIISDYIPAVYIKLQKDEHWFLESGFSYASPRLINAFTYRQNTKADYNHGNTTVTAYHLQKTFYNEVPFSFNVYVRPSWSLGTGAMYSWLRGAATNKETIVNDEQSGLQATTTQMIPVKRFTDSFLYKTQTSFLLQTSYEKNKWLFTLQYVKDMQPYITYLSPDGIKNSKKNTSLALMIRYRLFRSIKVKQD